QIASSKILYLGALFVFDIGFISLLIFLPFLGSDIISKKMLKSSQHTRLKIALFIFFIGAIIVASKNVNNMQGRYHLPLLFPVLLLIGFSFSSFVKWAKHRNKQIVAILLSIILLPMAVKNGAIAYYYNNSPREAASSYAVKRLIVEILKSDFGWNNDDIDFNVALWIEASGKHRRSAKPWASLKTDENFALSYIARVSTVIPEGKRFDGCALVQVPERRGMALTPLDENLIRASLPFSDGFHIEKVVEREDIRVVGYRYNNPNCVRSFGNAYFMSDAEILAEDMGAGLKPLEARTLGWKADTHQTVSMLPNHSPILIEISNNDNKAEVTLHANALRGHAVSFKITRAGMSNFGLTFTSLNSEEIFQIKENKAIGVIALNLIGDRGLYSPWVMHGPKMPSGRYSVDLTIGKFAIKGQYPGIKEKGFLKNSGPYIIRLTDELVWR
ncbi:MAG: hypothetical protein HOF10_02935, partial [Chloroflexi bacterium]|nr:hypothetical protein [Chloroflexota bacterium]